jgi:hypothetical protein
VVQVGEFLFTRVDLKSRREVSSSTLESQASLFALRNFALFISPKVTWAQLSSGPEREIVLDLYRRSAPDRVTVTGLTLVSKLAGPESLTFIYAGDAPSDNSMRISESEVLSTIRDCVKAHPDRIDYLSYIELVLRYPNFFDAKLAVKGLAASYGEYFPLFLLNLEIPNPEPFAKPPVCSETFTATDRNEIAKLLGHRPYHPMLALRLAESLRADSHEEVAKLAIAGSARLSKTGDNYERVLTLSRQLNIPLTGSYIHPVPPWFISQVRDEFARAGITLNPCLENLLVSLGDLPLKAVGWSKPSPPSSPASGQLSGDIEALHLDVDSCRRPEQLASMADLFIAYGFPRLAFCFYNQAFTCDPGNERLREKVRSTSIAIGMAQYSKTAGVQSPR